MYIKQGRRYRAAHRNEILDAAAELVDEQIGKLTVVHAPGDTIDLLRMLTAGRGHENLVVVFLDTRHRDHIVLKCRIVAACVILAEVREELLELAERCDRIRQKRISLASMELVVTKDLAALRKLSGDPRILQRLALLNDAQVRP